MNLEQLEFELRKLGTSSKDVYHLHIPGHNDNIGLHNMEMAFQKWVDKHDFKCKFVITGDGMLLQDKPIHKPWLYCNYCGRDLTKTDDRCMYCSNEPVCPVCRGFMEITTKENIVKLECHNPKCNHIMVIRR